MTYDDFLKNREIINAQQQSAEIKQKNEFSRQIDNAVEATYRYRSRINDMIKKYENEVNKSLLKEKGYDLDTLAANEDWTEKSTYSSKYNPDEGVWYYNIPGTECVLEYINAKDADTRKEITSQRKIRDRIFYDLSDYGLDQLSDYEKQIANYLGQTDPKKLKEYIDKMEGVWNIRGGEQDAQKLKESGNIFGYMGNALEAGLENSMDGFKSAILSLAGEDPSEYLEPSRAQVASQIIKENDNLSDFGKFMYDVGVTVSQQIPNVLLSAGLTYAGMPSAAVMLTNAAVTGFTAAGSGYAQGMKEGLSVNQSRTYGALSGASEAALGMLLNSVGSAVGIIPKGGIESIAEGIDNGLLRFLAKTGLQGISEGTEEFLQEPIGMIFKNAVSGKSVDEWEKIDWSEATYAGLLGMFIGSAMNVPNNVGDVIAQKQTKNDYNKKMFQNDNVKTSENFTDLEEIPFSASLNIENKNADGLKSLTNKNSKDGKFISIDSDAVKEIGKAFGVNVEFKNLDKYKTDDMGNKILISPDGAYEESTRTIYLNSENSEMHNPAAYVIKHELAHSLESNNEGYIELKREILDSNVFKRYCESAGYNSEVEFRNNIIEEYRNNNVSDFNATVSQEQLIKNAESEMVADFVGNVLFGGKEEITVQLLESMQPQHRITFREWISELFNKLKNYFSKNRKAYAEIEKFENKFIETANMNKLNSQENNLNAFAPNVKTSVKGFDNADTVKNGLVNTEKPLITGLSAANEKPYGIEGIIENSVGAEKTLTYDQKVLTEIGNAFGLDIEFKNFNEQNESLNNESLDGAYDKDIGKVYLNTDFDISAQSSPANYIIKSGISKLVNKNAYEYGKLFDKIENSLAFEKYSLNKLINDNINESLRYVMPEDFVCDVLFNGEKSALKEFFDNSDSETKESFIKLSDNIFEELKSNLSESDISDEIKKFETEFEESNGNSNQDDNLKYSYALVTNKSKIEKAEKMENEGYSVKEIWESLDVIRDPEGIWLYEISDYEMELFMEGDVLIREDENYAEFMKLRKKIRKKQDIDKETLERYSELEKEFADKYDYGDTLKNYIVHDKLFERYPQIADIKLCFKDFEDPEMAGSFSPFLNTITVSDDIISKIGIAGVESAIIHEIQHAIQRIDKREAGTSVEIWKMIKSDGKKLPTNPVTGKECTPFEAYFYSKGEVEARDTQDRYGLDDNSLKYEYLPELGWGKVVKKYIL